MTAARRLRYGALVLLAVLVATPGVHVAERWLDHETSVVVTHGLALCLLGVVAWRWRATRPRGDTAGTTG